MYSKYMAKTKQPPRTVSLESGGYGHWIGSPDASHVLIWYHGGGFGLPANRGYFKYFARLLADANKSQPNSLSVFCLTYTLAPHAQYPTQLRQAVDCLRHVLETHTPEKVLLGGDSAGGNLVGGVLSHLAHTHPEIKPIKLSGAQIKGAIMLSPWTSLDSEFPDQIIDSRGDIITEYVAAPWAGAYLGSAARDFYTDLSRAPTEWYAAFPVERMLVCAGGTEIMLPLLEDLAGKIKAGRQVEFVVGERECHVAPVYHLYVGEGTETEQGREVKVFLRECIEKA